MQTRASFPFSYSHLSEAKTFPLQVEPVEQYNLMNGNSLVHQEPIVLGEMRITIKALEMAAVRHLELKSHKRLKKIMH